MAARSQPSTWDENRIKMAVLTISHWATILSKSPSLHHEQANKNEWPGPSKRQHTRRHLPTGRCTGRQSAGSTSQSRAARCGCTRWFGHTCCPCRWSETCYSSWPCPAVSAAASGCRWAGRCWLWASEAHRSSHRRSTIVTNLTIKLSISTSQFHRYKSTLHTSTPAFPLEIQHMDILGREHDRNDNVVFY